jgi:serine/threonine protein kinase
VKRLSRDEWRELEPLIDAVLDTPRDQHGAVSPELRDTDAERRAEFARVADECEADLPLLRQPASERFASLFDDVPMPEMLADRYRIREEIGRGGMAIVYAGRDVKHGRDVAVKVLREEVAAALGQSRFLREIEIVAQLRHPNIVPLYDSGEAGGLLYYVMPYEAGHSLRHRLSLGGPLPVDHAVAILRDVCDALAYAHAQGVVHRDIKPDNVLLSGRHALVSDFGIARAVTAAGGGMTLTADGVLLGTPQYMAPEQVAGEANVDHRADIYSVGVLAYELLTGRPPFAGDSPQAVLTAHLVQPPAPLSAHRADIPPALADIVMRCLAKQPAERWQTADELLRRLDPMAVRIHSGAFDTPSNQRARVSRSRLAIGATLGVGLLAAVGVALMNGRGQPPAPIVGRTSQLTSERGLEVQPTISPDGKHVAYAAGNSLRTRIFVRPVAGGRTLTLTNDTTENEWMPRWSPDGSRILFLARGGVFSAPAFGGAAHQEVPSRPGSVVTSATWSADGREIAYTRGDSLVARNVATGALRLLTTRADLHSCAWSPNGKWLACVAGNSFYVTVGKTTGGPMFGNLAPSAIVIVPSSGGSAVSVTDSASLHQSPAWSPDGRTLFYVSNEQGTRDVYALSMTDGASGTRTPQRLTTGLGAHSVTVSADGARMVYAVYSTSANVWTIPIPHDTVASNAAAVQVTSGNQTVEGVRVSGDRKWLVYDSDLSGNSDIYRMALAGGEPEHLTSSPIDEFRGAIAPNGNEMAYHTFETGSRNLFLLPLDGGPARQLTRSARDGLSMANWSPDGSAIAAFNLPRSTVHVLRRDAAGRWSPPRMVANDGWRPEWSPDGRRLVFVTPRSGAIRIVSADSGALQDVYTPGPNDPYAELASFADDGRAVYFKSHDRTDLRASFWSVPVDGGRPRLLVRFDDPERASNRFDFATDGKRFYFTIEDRQSDLRIAELTKR